MSEDYLSLFSAEILQPLLEQHIFLLHNNIKK